MNLPTKITVLRLFMVPPVVALLAFSSPAADLAAAIIFCAASFSDWLDGYLARSRKEVTAFGKILDPLADKLLVACTLIVLVGMDRAVSWIVAVIIGREILITGLRGMGASQGHIIQAQILGKLKMVFQVAAVLLLILNWNLYGLSFKQMGSVALWVVMVLSVISGYQYWVRFHSKMDADL